MAFLHRSLLSTFSTCALLACSSQADTTYEGEPLATISGTVSALAGPAPAPVDPALVWWPAQLEQSDANAHVFVPNFVATQAPATGSFPAKFTMQIFLPPPDDVLQPCIPGNASSGRFALASILALRQGADPSSVQPTDIFGDAVDFQVVYADSDLARDGCPALAATTIAPLTRGYHLLEWVPSATHASEDAAYGACLQAHTDSTEACQALLPDTDFAEASAGFGTPISLTLQSTPVPFEPEFAIGISLDPNLCAAWALPQNATTGSPACQVLVGLIGPIGPGSGTCGTSGLTPVGDDVSPLVVQFVQTEYGTGAYPLTTICELPEVPAADWSNGTCAQSPEPGWCFVTAPNAGACAQRFAVSAGTPSFSATGFPWQFLAFLVCENP